MGEKADKIQKELKESCKVIEKKALTDSKEKDESVVNESSGDCIIQYKESEAKCNETMSDKEKQDTLKKYNRLFENPERNAGCKEKAEKIQKELKESCKVIEKK